MFRVPTVLRRVPSAVPPTVVASDDRERLHHLRITGHNYALLSNPGNHHNPLIAGIAWERVVMAHSQMEEAFARKRRFLNHS